MGKRFNSPPGLKLVKGFLRFTNPTVLPIVHFYRISVRPGLSKLCELTSTIERASAVGDLERRIRALRQYGVDSVCILGEILEPVHVPYHCVLLAKADKSWAPAQAAYTLQRLLPEPLFLRPRAVQSHHFPANEALDHNPRSVPFQPQVKVYAPSVWDAADAYLDRYCAGHNPTVPRPALELVGVNSL